MKKVIYFVFFIVVFAVIIILIKPSTKKDINNIYNALVYIESSDNNTITSGSGFVYKIYDGKNYILTNYHVIEGYYDIDVYNSKNKKQKATLVKFDKANDIAVLSIDDKLDLNEVVVGDSSKINNGDEVLVIGNPKNIKEFGVITTGKIINPISDILDLYDFTPLAISAKTYFGSSGGPVLSNDGKVIGMIFLKSNNDDNISLAIPINYIMDFVNLENNKSIINLGAAMTNSDNIELLKVYNLENLDISGVVIINLDDNGILKSQGLLTGDIIIKINEEPVLNITELQEELGKLKKGDNLYLTYYRNGHYYKINFKI